MKDELTYPMIFSLVKKALNDDSKRMLIDTPLPFRKCWWPGSFEFRDTLMSDYGMETEHKTIENDFFHEVGAIQHAIMDEKDTDIMDGANARAHAMKIWDTMFIPLRIVDRKVYRIWAPRDIFGTPIIKELPIDTYLQAAVIREAMDINKELEAKNKSLAARWGRLKAKLHDKMKL